MARTRLRLFSPPHPAWGRRLAAAGLASVFALVASGCGGSSPAPPVPPGTSVAIGGAVGSADGTAAAPPGRPAPGGDPFSGARLYVDPTTAAAKALRQSGNNPVASRAIARISGQPVAYWVTGTEVDAVQEQVAGEVAAARTAGAMPLLVAYDIPGRDCSGHSGGGATSPDEYRAWIAAFAAGIGSGPAAVILEPDALANADCLSGPEQQARFSLLSAAVNTLAARNVSVYLDGGNSHWRTPAVMAARLVAAGVGRARGFALNVSNFNLTSEELRYGQAIDAAMNHLSHFVIDTSRNGVGPAPGREWCNPPGRALGHIPTVSTGNTLADALLWVKRPGESDGTCNGGPAAGSWWTSYAVGLADRAAG